MKKLKWSGFLLIICAEVCAAPLASDLLAACEYSLANGFQGSNGMMCVWYVTPCDCSYGKESVIPRVCLPDGKTPESLAREVINDLKSQTELQSESAEMAAAMILSPKYPCD